MIASSRSGRSPALTALSQLGIINGTGNYRFEPKRAITRA
ncbi:S-layer homology domain-containing protein, partial [Paenibacillus sp. MCAF20]